MCCFLNIEEKLFISENKIITDFAIAVAGLAGVSLLSVVIVAIAPVPDSFCLWQ